MKLKHVGLNSAQSPFFEDILHTWWRKKQNKTAVSSYIVEFFRKLLYVHKHVLIFSYCSIITALSSCYLYLYISLLSVSFSLCYLYLSFCFLSLSLSAVGILLYSYIYFSVSDVWCIFLSEIYLFQSLLSDSFLLLSISLSYQYGLNQGWALRSFPFRMFRSFPFF